MPSPKLELSMRDLNMLVDTLWDTVAHNDSGVYKYSKADREDVMERMRTYLKSVPVKVKTRKDGT